MGHNRKILVFKDVNYGASKTSATQNTAANPADLGDGSVGIYGVHLAGATNLNKVVLITNGGSETAGFVPAASFVGTEVFIAQGVPLTAGGSAVRLTNRISITPAIGIRKNAGKVFTAPVRGVLRIGYNGTTGTSFNLPATILRGDDFIVSLFNRNYIVAGGREPGQKVLLSAQAAAGDSPYTLATKFVAKFNVRAAVSEQLLINPLLLKIITGATGSAFSNSATIALTNGSTGGAVGFLTSAAHGVTTGQYIILNGDLYIAANVPDTTHITLDRPWQQATTAALANASTVNTASTSAPATLGLELVDNADFRNIEAAVQGILQNATIKRQTLPTPGSGSNAEVVAMEKEYLGVKGTEDQITAYQPRDIIYSQVAGLTYDLYEFETQNTEQPRGELGSVFRVINQVILAFVSGVANTTNKNQADFEAAMITLFGATNIPAIS